MEGSGYEQGSGSGGEAQEVRHNIKHIAAVSSQLLPSGTASHSPQRGGRGVERGGALAGTGHQVGGQLHTCQAGVE